MLHIRLCRFVFAAPLPSLPPATGMAIGCCCAPARLHAPRQLRTQMPRPGLAYHALAYAPPEALLPSPMPHFVLTPVLEFPNTFQVREKKKEVQSIRAELKQRREEEAAAAAAAKEAQGSAAAAAAGKGNAQAGQAAKPPPPPARCAGHVVDG